jgi:uncharacterized membrane protein
MSLRTWAIAWAGAIIPFLAIDLTWLGFIARDFYRVQMGALLADQPRWAVAFLFYGLYCVGVVLFAVMPGLAAGSLVRTALLGAAFGFFCYATYDLTALSVIRGYPALLAVADIAWGTVLTAVVAACSHQVVRWLG